MPKTKVSAHFKYYRKERNENINKIGEGNVIYRVRKYREEKQKEYLYEITDTGVMLVRATDDLDYVVTKMILRKKRLLEYWENAPQWLIELTEKHTREGMWI